MTAPVPDPTNLTRDASLNRFVVHDVAGIGAAYDGWTGRDLLSRDAVLQLLERHCPSLPVDPAGVAGALQRGLAHPAAATRAEAQAVAAELARRLAALIAALRHPSSVDAQGSVTAGRRRYLEHWQSTGQVVLGGGLLTGLCPVIVEMTQTTLDRSATPPTRLGATAHPGSLALIGAARTAATRDGRVLVVDGGHSSLKFAVATLAGGALVELERLAPRPVAGVTNAGLSEAMRAGIVDAVLAIEQEGRPLEPTIWCSVATYMRDGRPRPDGASIYEILATELDWLRDQVGKATGPRRIELLHDGTAAWRGANIEATGPSAVIVLGSWLGVGLGPQAADLRPLAPTFSLAAV